MGRARGPVLTCLSRHVTERHYKREREGRGKTDIGSCMSLSQRNEVGAESVIGFILVLFLIVKSIKELKAFKRANDLVRAQTR